MIPALIALAIVAAVWLALQVLDRMVRSQPESAPGDVVGLARGSCVIWLAIALAGVVGVAALVAMGAAGL